MVIGIDGCIVAARAAQKLQRDVGDDFIGIHVGGGAGTALQHVDNEVVETFTCDDQIAGRDDGVGNVRLQRAKIAVGHGGRLLHHGKRLHEFRIMPQQDAGDREVVRRPGRVDAEVGIVPGICHSPIESRSVRVWVMTASQCIASGHSSLNCPTMLMIAEPISCRVV